VFHHRLIVREITRPFGYSVLYLNALMRRLHTIVLVFGASACIAWSASADVTANPYVSVIERNPFGLKEPPPPPAPPPLQPTVALPKIILTGIVTSLLGSEPRVLLEITEQEPGKAANVKKPIMRQGEKDGMIEIISIDVANNQVTLKNGGTQTNLSFEIAKSSGPGPGLPTVPGLVPPPVSAPNMSALGGSGSPTIISPGGVNSAGRAGTGVSVFGGAAPVAASGSASPINSAYASSSGAQMAGINNALAANAGVGIYGAGNVPSRELRTDPNAAPTASQVYQNMIRQKTAADQAGIVLPPFPPSPHLQGPGGIPPSPPAIPNFPRR
jgi:hypothetical protein